MKVFSIIGVSGSGKTTTVEAVVAELRRRNWTVGTVKDIHFQGFALDREGTNTFRHKTAGAQLVTARGMFETDLMFPTRLALADVLAHYHHDYVVLEGTLDFYGPGIIAAGSEQEIDERRRDAIFAVVGRIANRLTEYRGLPVIDVLTNPKALVDLIENSVLPWNGQEQWLKSELGHE